MSLTVNDNHRSELVASQTAQAGLSDRPPHQFLEPARAGQLSALYANELVSRRKGSKRMCPKRVVERFDQCLVVRSRSAVSNDSFLANLGTHMNSTVGFGSLLAALVNAASSAKGS